MNTGITTGTPIQWQPAPAAVTFDVTVTVAPTSAPVCYSAANPTISDAP